jgi:hypothetical protein
MAWWLCRNLTYVGPDFDWVDPGAVAEKRGLVGSGLCISRPLNAKNVPKAARCRRPYPKKPSVDIFIVDYAVAVTGRFRELVERFEPGLHLFVPIELQFFDGTPMDGEYYFFSTNVDIDCILTDNKDEWFRDYGRGNIQPTITSIEKLTPREIYLSKPQIEGCHLWTGGPLGYCQLFVSDEFCAALRNGKFRSIDIRRECQELDRPWVAEEQMGPLLDKWQNYVANDRNVEVGYI